MNRTVLRSFAASVPLVLLSATPAQAYIGPGGGLSALGALLALVVALLVAFIGFVWYPLRRMLRQRRERATLEADEKKFPTAPTRATTRPPRE